MRRSRSDSEDSSGGENLLALGSSFITSGSLENSDSGGNGSKKQRLEFQGFEMSEFDSSNVGGVHQAGALRVSQKTQFFLFFSPHFCSPMVP